MCSIVLCAWMLFFEQLVLCWYCVVVFWFLFLFCLLFVVLFYSSFFCALLLCIMLLWFGCRCFVYVFVLFHLFFVCVYCSLCYVLCCRCLLLCYSVVRVFVICCVIVVVYYICVCMLVFCFCLFVFLSFYLFESVSLFWSCPFGRGVLFLCLLRCRVDLFIFPFCFVVVCFDIMLWMPLLLCIRLFCVYLILYAWIVLYVMRCFVVVLFWSRMSL